MPDGSATLTLTLHPKIADIPPADWDACAGRGNPFVSHAFLSAMEDSGSANARTGWLPQHAVLRGEAGQVVAVAPMYAKSHSYGEYVFDHGWAHALERAGGDYYPKLQVAAPFSPAPGPRLLRHPDAGVPVAALASALEQACRSLDLSSVHVTFCTEDGMAGARRGRLAAAYRHAVPLGECRLQLASTTSSARCRRASARCCGANGATRMPPA